jgi:hypothetical protein
MFLCKLPTILCRLTAVAVMGIGLSSTAAITQSPRMCTSIAAPSPKLVGATCNPNNSGVGCLDAENDWLPMTDENDEIRYTRTGTEYWHLDGGGDRIGWIDKKALWPLTWPCERSN